MLTASVADFIVKTGYSQIPEKVIELSKGLILDCLGVALAGVNEEGSKILVGYINDMSCKPEASIIGYDLRSTVDMAALANGTMAHGLDYDDYSMTMYGHPAVTILPAILAMAEKHKKPGKSVLESYILGVEVACNLNPTVAGKHFSLGWHCTATWGSIAALLLSPSFWGLMSSRYRQR